MFTGKITWIHAGDLDNKANTHHVKKEDLHYEIKSEITDHLAVHKKGALNNLKS